MALAFYTAAGHAFHKEALAQNEDDERRQNRDGCAGQDQVGAVGGAAAQHVKGQRQHVVLGVAGVYENRKKQSNFIRFKFVGSENNPMGLGTKVSIFHNDNFQP